MHDEDAPRAHARPEEIPKIGFNPALSSSADTALRNATGAHAAGRLTEAEVGYHRVLRARADDPQALYGLGLLSFHAGAIAKGIDYVTRCVISVPAHGRAWITLGSMHIAAGDTAAAMTAFWRATDVAPDLSDGWYNAGICLKEQGDFVEAAAHLRRSLECPAPYPQAYDALGSLLYQQGLTEEASETYATWATREPENPKARHMAAAAAVASAQGLSPQGVPDRASDAYVQAHFDAAAARFDSNLQRLGYRAPELVASALARMSAAATTLDAVLDAGCGTGLCGPLIRSMCGSLAGVDLAPQMLAVARSRDCYDELVAAELSAFMRSRNQSFDAIISADTLVYFGALDEPLSAARGALRGAGILIFTVEALTDPALGDYRLELSGRFAHSEAYLRRVLGSCGFRVDSLSPEKLREERAAGVIGHLVVARAT